MFILLMLVISAPAWALTPPIEEKELVNQADLVVRGEITDIRCAPNAFEQGAHATTTHYIATLDVNTVKKGRWPGRTIPILFWDVHYVRGYVGDADHVFRVGERGLYYLVSRDDGHWALINWSAAFVKRHGDGPLPTCR
jgi:hypothetical protein